MTYDQIAEKDLEYLGLKTCPIRKYFLQDTDEHMPKWSADHCAICCHFRYSGTEIMAMFATIVRKPGCQNLL